jgi:NNP family nitrate/nitrite transporter-like MFS transporter
MSVGELGSIADGRPADRIKTSRQESSERARVLMMATLGFTIFFAVWVMFAIVGIPLRKELGLSDGQFALLVAIPILTGSILRVPFGILTDRVGGRRVFTALLVVTAIPTYLVSRASGYTELIVLAFFVGLAGISFAVGIAWVSAWYPPHHQGFALGTFGAGNVGASVTKLLAPTLVTLVAAGGVAGGAIPGGWRLVPFVFAIMLLLTAAAVLIVAPTPDHRPAVGRTLADLSRPLKVLRVWRFGLYYIVVFGAYVALSLWLPKYYVDVYGMELRDAGFLTALFIFPASLLRPLGGYLSDRLGPRPVTYTAFVLMCGALVWLTFSTGIVLFTVLVVVVGVMMGIGKASVFKYIADYFPRDVGAVGGLVGAVGGLGGFVLPLLFAWAQAKSGRPESTFLVLLAAAVVSLVWLHLVVIKMRRDERRRAAARPAGVRGAV